MTVTRPARPVSAAGPVTIVITKGGAPIGGAFVALTGSTRQPGGLTDGSGQTQFTGIATGTYPVPASAPGTAVGSTSVSVASSAISASIPVADSGNKFRRPRR